MININSEMSWFLAQLKPNSYNIAKRNLERQLFPTFLPMLEETRRDGAKFSSQMRPLFPGYIFVAFSQNQGGWRAVNSTSGIVRLVCFGSEPAPVPSALISELMLRCDEFGKIKLQNNFEIGETVTLSGGPFTDFVATIESISPDRRVFVLIELMGAQTRVSIRPEHLPQRLTR